MSLHTFELMLKNIGDFTTALVDHPQSNESQLVIYESYGANNTRRVAVISMSVTDSKSTNFNNFKVLKPEIRKKLSRLIDDFAAIPINKRFGNTLTRYKLPCSTDVVLIDTPSHRVRTGAVQSKTSSEVIDHSKADFDNYPESVQTFLTGCIAENIEVK